jgi:hypothetical protein
MGRVEELSFAELVQELADYEQHSEPPDLERSIRRSAVDRRLMRLLCDEAPSDERRAAVRVPGDIGVRLYAGDRALEGTIVDLGEGGIGVALAEAPPEAQEIDVEVLHDPPEPQSRARAKVMWQRPRGGGGFTVGLHFLGQTDAHRRRMRRLVVEVLRKMPSP